MVQHPNIVELHEVMASKFKIYFTMELICGGDHNSFTEHLKQDGLLHTMCGTLCYVAPKVIGKKGYDGAKALWVVQV
ncbi:cbl-interacting serine/threonine-protein kinase 6 [Quercus suber]|uniref:Cbl-interacting serine/threonine-protein kinase 6 n=1 Tax=Quercus suber TaxID=58331 RepID=A0AAW0LXU5_QUESU